jgi:hypothetical protein
MKAIRALHELGQSIWLDNITRDLLDIRGANCGWIPAFARQTRKVLILNGFW